MFALTTSVADIENFESEQKCRAHAIEHKEVTADAMKYKYRKIPDDSDPSKRWIARPILQVRLYYGTKHQDIRCLVDSGADDCLFHSSVGEVLGIDVQAGRVKRFAGIAAGQFVDAYMHTIQMQIQGFSEKIDQKRALLIPNGYMEYLASPDSFTTTASRLSYSEEDLK